MAKGPVEFGLPDKIELHHRGSYIEIVRKWFGGKILFMTAFVVFWNWFIVDWYMAFSEGAPLIFMLVPLFLVAVGIGLTYYVLAGWFNRTHIFVSYGKIAVRHKPIPWFGNKEITASDLKQLYTREVIHHSHKGGTSVTYAVLAITHGGQTTTLVGGLESSEQALFIEREIEKYLNITDVPVKGEFSQSSG